MNNINISENVDSAKLNDYITNTLFPLMELFEPENMYDVDKLLTSFYKLDDVGRTILVKMIHRLLDTKSDPKRAEVIKSIPTW